MKLLRCVSTHIGKPASWGQTRAFTQHGGHFAKRHKRVARLRKDEIGAQSHSALDGTARVVNEKRAMALHHLQSITIEGLFDFALIRIVQPALDTFEAGVLDTRELFIERPFAFAVNGQFEQ
ncbi:MAG: hypothetical protein JWN98_19 [Abditibacteriota bacterium]|nr:hypothetical protein [Abditibacteriota bacterium]